MKIAIYSGTVPSTTFIEHLIIGLSEYHTIFLFGVEKNKITYQNKSIHKFVVSKANYKKVVITLIRTLIFVFYRPKDWLKFIKVVWSCETIYQKWTKYTRELPIILHKPDIFHIQWAKDVDRFIYLKEIFNIKLILSLRGAHINYSPITDLKIAEMYESAFPKIDAFHAVSESVLAQAGLYDKTLIKKAKIIHSPLPDRFIKEFVNDVGEENDVINIISVGRFHWIKGYRYALEAIKELKKRNYKVKYTIVGGGIIPDEIRFLISAFNLEQEIEILPKLSQNELIDLYKSKDVILLPSINEGIANVVLEAMAVGLPVLSSDCGGMSEVIIQNETGFLVPIRKPSQIANSIVRIKTLNKESLLQIKNNAFNMVNTHFNYDKSINDFIKLYQNVFEEKSVEK